MAKIDRIQEMLDYGFGLDERIRVQDSVDYWFLLALQRTLNEVEYEIILAREQSLILAGESTRKVGSYIGGPKWMPDTST